MAAATLASATDGPICFTCFWEYQPSGFAEELASFYESRPPDDPLPAADVRYLVARVRGDGDGVCEAYRRFETLRRTQRDLQRRLFVDEFLAFTAAECGGEPKSGFRRAARSARKAGESWKARVYTKVARQRFDPAFGEATIGRRLEVPADATGYVLGESAIRIEAGTRIGSQVDRTVRDWISYQMHHDFSERPPGAADLLDYHEGARLRNVLDGATATVIPLSGTLVARRDDRWYAPDESGTFRFEVLPDKLQYPTTRVHGDLALIVDTHGISSLVERSARHGVELVVGCGDHPAKARAAYHLARRGADVYFPCDRFVGELIGHDAPGTLIGSAPVRAEAGGTVIGDRPVAFRIDEPLVVEDTGERGAVQYYDAPARYFRRLAESVPLRLEIVEVDAAGQSGRVVERARRAGATAIAVRVWTAEDYAPVREWLAESPAHRAVLFHSAPYPAGERLFDEFPGQTTFGDPHPRFLP